MRDWFWLIAFFLSISGVSAFAAEEFLKPLPAEVMTGEILTLAVKPSFHFEMKAPQLCDGRPPAESSARALHCRFTEAGERPVSLSVCDDAKTFCKPVKFNVHVISGGEVRAHATDPSAALKTVQTEIKHQLIPGFEAISPKDLVNNNKPVFVMISTDWCPPCNEFKEILLSSDGFRDAIKGWRLVYVDGDNPKSAEWNNVAHFFEYPSFALLTKDLKEVGRYHGENRLHDFSEWANEAKTFLARPIPELSQAARARKSGSWKQRWTDFWDARNVQKEKAWLIQWALAVKSGDDLALFEESDVPADLLADFLHWKMDKQEKLSSAEELSWRKRILAASENTEHFADDLDGLCDTDKNECLPFVAKLEAHEKWYDTRTFSSPAEKEVALINEYAGQVSIYKKIGDKERVRAAAGKCADLASSLAQSSHLQVPRAAAISQSYCLEESGRIGEADAIYRKLLKAYPSEATFLLRYANFFKKQNRFKEAHEWVTKALKVAYGYNWTRAIQLKANIEIGMKDPKAALKTIRGALQELDLSSKDPDNRDQRLALVLRGLEQKAIEKQDLAAEE